MHGLSEIKWLTGKKYVLKYDALIPRDPLFPFFHEQAYSVGLV